MQSQRSSLIALALLAVLSMSFVPILIKSSNANEITIGIVRLIIAIGLVTPFVAWKNDLRSLSKREWGLLTIVGLVFGVHWLTYFVSIKLSTAAIGALAVSTYGIHLLLLNVLFKRQAVFLLDWLIVALCFTGCVLVAPSLNLNDDVTLGLLVGIVSGFLYACLPLLHQTIMQVPTMVRVWGQFTFAALIFLPGVAWANWNLSSADWLSLLVLGVVCTVIGHSLWVKASSELPGIFVGVIYYLYVPIAMLMSFFILDEYMNSIMLLGAVCIVAANLATAVLAWYRSQRYRS